MRPRTVAIPNGRVPPLGFGMSTLRNRLKAVALVGWFNRRRWAWSLAVAILVTQIAGDLVNLYLGSVIEGAIGIAAAGALLFYLLRPPVRAAFRL
jgi:hypothetical protein